MTGDEVQAARYLRAMSGSAMTAARARMSSGGLIAWAMQRPEGDRCQLVAGEVLATASERWAQAMRAGRKGQ